jgi:hypothetical protein
MNGEEDQEKERKIMNSKLNKEIKETKSFKGRRKRNKLQIEVDKLLENESERQLVIKGKIRNIGYAFEEYLNMFPLKERQFEFDKLRMSLGYVEKPTKLKV